MNPEIKNQAEIILAQIYFDHVDIEEIIKWTRLVRSSGFKSLAIYLILNQANRTEKETIKLFLELKSELKIETKNNPESFFKKYALDIAVKYLTDELNAQDTIKKLLRITRESEDKDHYYPIVEFCFKHDILERNIKLKNIAVLKSKEVIQEFNSIILLFAESCHDLNLRVQLSKSSIYQLVEAKYLKSNQYEKLSLLIIDDIILSRGIRKRKINRIIKEFRSKR